MTTHRISHCSHCKRKARFAKVEDRALRRDHWRCPLCGGIGLVCGSAGCEAMARVEPVAEGAGRMRRIRGTRRRVFCAAHAGEVRSWEAVDQRLPDIRAWKQVEKVKKCANLRKGCHYVAGGVAVAGAAVVLAPLAPVMVTKAGAAGLLGKAGTGTAINSLSGVVLETASLAKVGGMAATGSKVATGTKLAVGGMSTMVVVPAAVDVHALLRELRSFSIDPVPSAATSRAGGKERMLLINGLLSETTESADDWLQSGLQLSGPAHLVRWDSNGLGTLGGALLHFPAAILPSAYLRLWKSAVNRTTKVAHVLAELIARTPEDHSYHLCGHSLGGRIVVETMAELGRRGERRVSGALLLGAAKGMRDQETWMLASRALRPGAELVNAWSAQDDVLGRLYRTAEFNDQACGRQPIPAPPAGIRNLDCTDLVPGHTKWKAHAGTVQRRGGLVRR